MTTAEPDERFRERLAAEAERWRHDGVITSEQATAILARYGLRPAAVRAAGLGPVVTLLAVLGAVIVGIGVIFFFAANWELLPSWSKVLLIFMGIAAAYAAGYWLQFRWGGSPRVGAGLILLGAILFQAGLFLLAQIYNMPVDSPVLLLLGAAGILPLAYAAGSRLVLVLGLLDAFAWLGWELLMRYPDAPERYAVPLVYLLMGVLVYTTGQLHRLRRDPHGFLPVYQLFGLLAIFLPAYVLSFGAFWEAARDEDLAALRVPLWYGGLVLLAVAGAGSLLLGGRRAAALAEAALFAGIALIAALVAFLPEGAGGYAFLFNVVFFGLAAFACVRGYLEGEARFVNAGIVMLAVGLITRYFDTFWELLPRSAFYITAGLVLLAVAVALERLRHRLLAGPDGPTAGAREGV